MQCNAMHMHSENLRFAWNFQVHTFTIVFYKNFVHRPQESIIFVSSNIFHLRFVFCFVLSFRQSFVHSFVFDKQKHENKCIYVERTEKTAELNISANLMT